MLFAEAEASPGEMQRDASKSGKSGENGARDERIVRVQRGRENAGLQQRRVEQEARVARA